MRNKIIKNMSILITLSFIVLIFAPEIQHTFTYLEIAHTKLNIILSYIFNTSVVGNTTQEAICLLVIPFVVVAIPAGVYWIIKKQLIPYFYHMVWSIWLILFTSLVLTH